MIHRNICPICGSENPEGSEFCQVCKANLKALPSEMFPTDSVPVQQEQETKAEPVQDYEKEPDLDSPVPVWLATKLKPSEKKPMDFDAFSDMLFGITDDRKANPPAKVTKPQKNNKAESVYQPPLQNIAEPPLIEPDENSPKIITEEIPGIADFLRQRPARKWEDKKPLPHVNNSSSISLLTDFSHERPAKKWDDHFPVNESNNDPVNKKPSETVQQLSIWWQEDAPLVEPDQSEETAKDTEADDPLLDNSVSPTKVADADELFSEDIRNSERNSRSEAEEFQPENGSLISELLQEMNSESGSLTPSEQHENREGTVFYSGNHPADGSDEESSADFSEITIDDEDNSASAATLDRILRNIGYEVGSTDKADAVPSEETKPQDPQDTDGKGPDQSGGPSSDLPKDSDQHKKNNDAGKASSFLQPLRGFFVPQVIDNPLIPDDDITEEKDADPYGLSEETIPEKDDSNEDMEIPWDLFGSADMSLPQSPEDPAYRTFSRSGIPEDPGSTTYQQRMISSILGKIIQAENFVQPQVEKNNRGISFWARLFLSILAICGTVIILNTNIIDSISVPAIPASPESEEFYEQTEAVSGETLVVVDYTPAYSSLMNNAAENLIAALEKKADKVRVTAVNPAAMPIVYRLLPHTGEKTEFTGWLPAGIISIRSQLAFGNIPAHTWLLTSESTSVRFWAEQLAVSEGEHFLHVMGPGQLEPLLSSYRQAGLVNGMLTNDADIQNYGEENHTVSRTQASVWYLTALVPLAWVFGIIGKAMSKEPDYGRKSKVKSEEIQQNTEKEPENG